MINGIDYSIIVSNQCYLHNTIVISATKNPMMHHLFAASGECSAGVPECQPGQSALNK